MAALTSTAGALYVNGVEVVLKSDTVSRTQIVTVNGGSDVVIDTRYVEVNPFFDGINNADIAVACTVRAEIFNNGIWSETGFIRNTDGRGTVGFSNLEGIVVQTGDGLIIQADSAIGGGGHGTATGSTTAPCRVIITYHGDLILPSSAIVKPEYIDSRSLATAWVFFDGTGAIQSSFNIASVTSGGADLWDVVFTTPMDNANYVLSGSAITDAAGSDFAFITEDAVTSRTVNGLRVRISDHAGSTVAEEGVSVTIFGGKNV